MRGDGPPVPVAWWRHLDDPALTRVMEDVTDGSFSLAAARDRLAEARAVARRDEGAELPTLDATGEAAVSDDGDRRNEDYSATAMAAYEVDLWGRLAAGTRAAELEADATAADLRAARISVTAEAADAYFGILRERDLLGLLREQREANRQAAELLELRFRRGNADSDQLLRQEQLLEDTEAQLAAVEGERQRLRAELAALLGEPGADAVMLPDDARLVDVPPLPDSGLPSEWLQRRPDLQAAFLRVQALDAELAAAIAERYPSLDLTASLETSATTPSRVFDQFLGRLVAGLTVPVFQGGRIEAGVDRARAARDVAFNEYAQTVLDAVASVETALARETADRERVRRLERQVELGEQVLDRLRTRYRNGGAAFLDVLDAQTTLQRDQRSLLEARWSLLGDRIDLVRELAGAWPSEAAAAAPADDTETEASD